MTDPDVRAEALALLEQIERSLRIPADQSAFGLETSWLIYNEARVEVADQLSAVLVQLRASACSGRAVGDGNRQGADGVVYPGDPAHCEACQLRAQQEPPQEDQL